MASASPFSPFRLRGLTLRNRVIKAATFEGMCPEGMPTSALVEYHRGIARGGAALTTVASAAVTPQGRSYATQLVMSRESVKGLRELTTAVHGEGGAASIQLGHGGGFTHKSVIGTEPLGPSKVYDRHRKSWSRAMTEVEISRIVGDFARAAGFAALAKFDAVELLFAHGHLVSQFLSPYSNHRDDRWGGSLDNRMRLAIEIARVVRSTVGAKIPVLAKINLVDGFEGGFDLADAVKLAKRLEAEGIDALVPTAGFASRAPMYGVRGEVPVLAIAAAQSGVYRKLGSFFFSRLFVQEYPFEELFLLEEAKQLRARVKIPVVLTGGIKSRASLDTAMAAGFELVGMARALVHEPGLVARLASGSATSSGCVTCNECLGAMERAGGIRCTKT
jgi:2,4-dienoyl-CoA reductase-like NADH-dependent reductase (Old Yellow Enzyme family)